MKKQLLILSAVALLSLASCGEKNTTTTPSVTTTPSTGTDTDSTTPVTTTPVTPTPTVTPTTTVTVPTTDPYENMSTTTFYQDYSPATSYVDATYRTEHNFVSGSIDDEDRYYLPEEYTLSQNYKVSETVYTYQANGDYESYKINYTSGKSTTIYYGGAYVSLNEVCAYIYAFGEVPPNSNYTSSKRGQSIAAWGKYGRCNIGKYSNNTTHYKYEPELPLRSESGTIYTYTETDFGSTGGFIVGGTNQTEYNKGTVINRGTCRIVFTDNAKNADERHVFYTYNHYNDFQEYLNYGGGFGKRFGNESNGGTYNSGSNPSPYIETTNIALMELRKLLGNV